MAIKPRIMIVDSLCTNVQENTQNISLTLLDRIASAEYSGQNPRGTSIVDILQYTRDHRLQYIGKPQVSLRHRRNHLVTGTDYHLGDVITEEKAFLFGYVEPHIDTLASGIVQAAARFQANAYETVGEMRKQKKTDEMLTDKLRKNLLITDDFSAMLIPGYIHIVANDRVDHFNWAHKSELNRSAINKTHPGMLQIFQDRKQITAGVTLYVPEKNMIYEFMTEVPLDKQEKSPNYRHYAVR